MDGPSGSGKSSTARGVATRLGLRYLDTGAQFRAITFWMLEHGVDFDDPSAIAAHAREPELVSGTDPQHPTIAVDGQDVAAAIRTQQVTDHVSAVASVPEVRAAAARAAALDHRRRRHRRRGARHRLGGRPGRRRSRCS